MEFKREHYIKKLISSKHNHLIKIVTGLRRVGKSYLLFNLYMRWNSCYGYSLHHYRCSGDKHRMKRVQASDERRTSMGWIRFIHGMNQAWLLCVRRWNFCSVMRSTVMRWDDEFKVQQPSFKAHAAVMLTKEASEDVCLIIVLQTVTDPSLRKLRSGWQRQHELWTIKHPLHPLVIISTFLFLLYFIKGQCFMRCGFMHIYTMYKGQKARDGKGVCTRATDRVHTVGWVSSDTMLQGVHTPNRGCAHGQMRMLPKTNEMHNYTIRLHKYAKLTVRESRIWARLSFWTKIGENFERRINYW